MIIVDNLKGLKKIKYDLANMDLSVIDKLSSGNRVFGFNYKGDYYIGRVVMRVSSYDSLILSKLGELARGRGATATITEGLDPNALVYKSYTTNPRLTSEIVKILPVELLNELDTVCQNMDFYKNFAEALDVFEKYNYTMDDIIGLYLQPLDAEDIEKAHGDILRASTQGAIVVEIAKHRRNREAINKYENDNFKRRFRNDYIIDNKSDLLENHSLFESYAYKIYENLDIAKDMTLIDGCKLHEIEDMVVWYYPEIVVVDPDRNEGVFSDIACGDYLYGIDIGTREAPTAIIDGEYIIGKDCSQHESHLQMRDIRFSAVHSGLVFSYLFQRNVALGDNGHYRRTIDRLLDDVESEGILYGEVHRGQHSIHTIKSKMHLTDNDEILNYAKSIMQVNAPINLIISDKVLRCNAEGQQERFVEIALKENKDDNKNEVVA